MSRIAKIRAVYESLKMALDSIRANKLRSVLTCLGIIIGVATVIGMMSIVNGIDGLMNKELNRIGASSFFLKKIPSIQVSMDWRKYHMRKDLTLDDVKAISLACPSIELVSPVVTFWNRTVRAGNEKTDPDVLLVGTTSTYTEINAVDLDEGREFTADEDRRPRDVAIVGRDVVDRLMPYGSPIGRYVRVEKWRLRVIGVLERRGSMFGQSQDAIIVLPLATVLKKDPLDDELEIALKARPDIPISRAIDEVRGLMRVRHKLKIQDEDDFELETKDSITKAWSNMTGSIFAAAIGIAAISLLVGGIGIMNVMLVSVRERTREIGVRKALGARPRDISRQFLIEASALSLLGGALGASLGLGGLTILTNATDKIPVEITSFSVVLALGFSIVVGLFFGVWPARKAARLDPIEALRYE